MLHMSTYQAKVEQDQDGRWSAWVDDLPGCAAWGFTRDEALAALRDAAKAYVEDMLETGEIPAPDGEVTIQEPMITA